MENTNRQPEDSFQQLPDGVLVADEVVDLFYQRLVRFAKRKLAALPPQVADEEGAVISALRSFFSGVEGGQFHGFNSENDMWRILATITARKAFRQMRVHWKQSGERNQVIRLSDIQHLVATEPSAQDELMIMEEFDHLINGLEDETLRKLVRLRLEGFESEDIADRLGIHVRSVQRKIKLVQTKWLENLNEL